MNPPKCDDLDYIHFLTAAQKFFTCTEAARCAPEGKKAPAHDAFTRLLSRKPPDTEALWQEVKEFVDLQKGLLILDDTTLVFSLEESEAHCLLWLVFLDEAEKKSFGEFGWGRESAD